MINTSYPAETIRDDILPSLNLSVTMAAKQLGISQARFSRILNGQVGINADRGRLRKRKIKHAKRAWRLAPSGTASEWTRRGLRYSPMSRPNNHKIKIELG